MVPEPPRLTPADRTQLVAYLDGELTEAEAQFVAAKVVSSPAVRREVETLERTWELLDLLPRPQAPADFSTRTLTQIPLQAPSQPRGLVPAWAKRRSIQGATCAITAILILGLADGTVRSVWPDPTARLARDLRLAEHPDEYRN